MWFNPETVDAASRQSLIHAFSEMIAGIRCVPTESFDWNPPDGGWSCRRILAHATHANDFYAMVCQEAVGADFTTIELTRQMPGYAEMVETNDAVLSTDSVESAGKLFEDRFTRLLAALDRLVDADIDRPFILSLDWSNEPAHQTTLRKRVIDIARDHMIEHRAQLAETVEQWRSTARHSS